MTSSGIDDATEGRGRAVPGLYGAATLRFGEEMRSLAWINEAVLENVHLA